VRWSGSVPTRSPSDDVRKHVGDALDLVESVIAPSGVMRISLYRDATDDFTIALDSLRDKPVRLPSKLDVMPLLPEGSDWIEGWRSFFALPFCADDVPDGVVVGAEGMVAHPERGAYPVFRGFLVHHAIVSGLLDNIANSLVAGSRKRHGTYGVVNSNVVTPREHIRVEAQLLRFAAASYRDGDHLLLRTLLIAENEIPMDLPSTFVGRGVEWIRRSQVPSKYLVASVASISRHFSDRAEKWLKRNTRLDLPSYSQTG
jgi:hypothetical protein